MNKPTVTLMQAEPAPVVLKASPSDLPLLTLALLDSIERIDEAIRAINERLESERETASDPDLSALFESYGSGLEWPELLESRQAERAAVVRMLDELGPDAHMAAVSVGLRRDVLRTKAHKRRD